VQEVGHKHGTDIKRRPGLDSYAVSSCTIRHIAVVDLEDDVIVRVDVGKMAVEGTALVEPVDVACSCRMKQRGRTDE
jgi:hypothetical protein